RRDAPVTLRLLNKRGLAYVLGSPSSLGLARAYVSGDLEADGVHPGDPYELLSVAGSLMNPRRPPVGELVKVLRTFGAVALSRPEPPPQEVPSTWRRAVNGLRHSRSRDAQAIHHHYDVSNRFYEMILGPSMTYTCACFP